ncbi:sperm-associated antigen 16 protein [Nothoprocta perdicaria]|uniref:sperm-associated antigen 16 protein n=1 Tax=Nothoprocta perdicaria TaxID=30464 RepID=UPI000E1BAA1A|nr:sperm-associated antigen 16 protein [Nothoprocta perdicaria]
MEEAAVAASTEAAFCLHTVSNLTKSPEVTITDDSEDDCQYEEVPADDEFSIQEGDEDLPRALRTIQEQAEDAQILATQSVLSCEKSVSEVPGAVDDFLCNFLVRLGMSRTLDCFQSEWYELIQRGVLTAKDTGLVPSVYTRNQQLETENTHLKKDLENYKLAANKAKEALLKMQKERDFHRMHHKRVVQEKNKLICDIKRLKAHYASYEPVLKQLTEKYQTTLRQKMLTSLERDRAVGQITGLQAALQNLESGHTIQNPVTKAGQELETKKGLEGPTQKALQEARQRRTLDTKSSSYDPVKDSVRKGKRY